MKITCRFFASVREDLGQAELSLDLPPEVTTVGQVREFLRQRGGIWAEALAADKLLRMAMNHEMTEADTLLGEDAEEVAFFPPVTGG